MEPMSDASISQTTLDSTEPNSPAINESPPREAPPTAAPALVAPRPSGSGRLSGADLVTALAAKDDPGLNAALEEAMRGLSDEEKIGDPTAMLSAAEPTEGAIMKGRIANI